MSLRNWNVSITWRASPRIHRFFDHCSCTGSVQAERGCSATEWASGTGLSSASNRVGRTEQRRDGAGGQTSRRAPVCRRRSNRCGGSIELSRDRRRTGPNKVVPVRQWRSVGSARTRHIVPSLVGHRAGCAPLACPVVLCSRSVRRPGCASDSDTRRVGGLSRYGGSGGFSGSAPRSIRPATSSRLRASGCTQAARAVA
jgi:hypothetical protein